VEQSEQRYSPGVQAVRIESPMGRLFLSTSEGYGAGACILCGKKMNFCLQMVFFGALLPYRNPVPD